MYKQTETPAYAHKDTDNDELNSLNFSPYLRYALKLVAKPRRGGGNMFRHQMETFAVLLDYGYFQPVLLKAALIHDLIEDSDWTGFFAYDEIADIDADGEAVLSLVNEMSQRKFNGVKEPKGVFLLRIMEQGTQQAKILKLADRISNLTGLPQAGDQDFIKSYIIETEQYILPFAGEINTGMANEIKERLETIKKTVS
jgi:(p)ppGpp synthase/HD superfamily hydrolase